MKKAKNGRQIGCHANSAFVKPIDIWNVLLPKVFRHLNIRIGFGQKKTTFDVTKNNITDTDFQKAGDMFFYLISCTEPVMEWEFLYGNIFKDKPPGEIVLVLNRLLKGTVTFQNINLKMIARKLLKKTSSLFSLNYTSIQKMIEGGKIGHNISVKGMMQIYIEQMQM